MAARHTGRHRNHWAEGGPSALAVARVASGEGSLGGVLEDGTRWANAAQARGLTQQRRQVLGDAMLRACGLDTRTAAEIRMEPEWFAPEQAQEEGLERWGAGIGWKVTVRQGDAVVEAHTGPLGAPEGRDEGLVAPWPVEGPEGTGNVFGDANVPYAVRATMHPGAGVTVDDVPISRSESGSEQQMKRVIGVFPTQAGMLQPRVALSVVPGAEEEIIKVTTLVRRGGQVEREEESMTPAALRERLVQARQEQRGGRGGRARRRSRADRAAFQVPVGGPAEAALEALWDRYAGQPRPGGDGLLLPGDLSVLYARLRDEEPAQAHESVLAPERQRVTTAGRRIATDLGRSAQATLREALDSWRDPGNGLRAGMRPAHLVAPIGEGAEESRLAGPGAIQVDGGTEEEQRRAERTARRLCHFVEGRDRTQALARTLQRFRNGPSVVRLGAAEDGVRVGAEGEHLRSNDTADQVGENVVLLARLPDAQPGSRLSPYEMGVPAGAWPAFDPITIGTNGVRTYLRPTEALAFGPGNEALEPQAIGIAVRRRGEDGEVVEEVVPLGSLEGTPGTGEEQAQAGVWIDPVDAQCAERSHVPWPGHRSSAREAIVVKAMRQALGPGDPRLLQPVDSDGAALENGPPTYRMRLGVVKGDPARHEDAITISRSAAEAVLTRITRSAQYTLDPQRMPDARWGGPANREEREELMRQTGIRGNQLEHFAANGFVREGTLLEPGQPVQVWSSTVEEEGESRRVWHVERYRGRFGCQVHRVSEGTQEEEPGRTQDPDQETGRRVVRVTTEEWANPGTLGKLYTLGGVKGILIVKADEDMPHFEVPDPRTPGEVRRLHCDIAIEDGGFAARAAVGDWHSVRLGHLVEDRGLKCVNEAWTVANEVEGMDPNLTMREAIAGIGDMDQRVMAGLAWTSLRERSELGTLAALRVQNPGEGLPRNGQAPTLGELLPVDDGATVEQFMAGVDAMDAAMSPAGADVTYAEIMDSMHVAVPAGAGIAHAKAVEAVLGYEPDEELVVQTATADRDTGYARACPGGVIDVLLTDSLGQDVTSVQALGRASGQVAGDRAPRIGVMEHTALGAAGAGEVLEEAFATSHRRTARAARDAIVDGRPWEAPVAVGHPAYSRARAYAEGLGCSWDGDGRIRALGEEALHERYPYEVGPRDDGAAPSAALDAQVGHHITLERPVLHPAFARDAAALMGMGTRRLVNACTFGERADGSSLPEGLAVGVLESLRGRVAPHVVGGNAAQQVKAVIGGLVEAAANDPEGLRVAVETAMGSSPAAGSAVGARFVQAVEDLIEKGKGTDTPFVLERLAIPAQAHRSGHMHEGRPEALRERDRLDGLYQTVIEGNEDIRERRVQGEGAAGATQALALAVRPLVEHLSGRLAGKRGILNREIQGFRPGSGAYVRALPDDTGRLPMGYVGLPHKVAAGLFEAQVVGRWWRSRTREEHVALDGDTEARKKASLAKKVRRALAEPTHPGYPKARGFLEAAVASGPVVATRYPALHVHNTIALRVALHEDPKDESVRIHPGLCAPIAGDFDGDALAITVPLTPKTQAVAMDRLGVANHLNKRGDGSPHTAPSHAAKEGCLALIRHEGIEAYAQRLTLEMDAGVAEHPQVKGALERGLAAGTGAGPEPKEQWEAFHKALGIGGKAEREGAVPVIEASWRAGFTVARERCKVVSLAQYEALEELCGIAKRAQGSGLEGVQVLEQTPEPVTGTTRTMEADLALAAQAADRHGGWYRQMQAWVEEPETAMEMAELAGDMGHGEARKLVAEALEPVRSVMDGARMKPRELVRVCAEAGAVKSLAERPLGTYHTTGILGELSLEARRDLARGGGDTEVSNHARVGLSGYAGQLMTKALGDLYVVLEDCERPQAAKLEVERLGPWAQGAHLQTPVDPDGAGEIRVLDEETVGRLMEAGGTVDVRTPAGCGAPAGVCRECCGDLAGFGGPPPVGTHLGDLTATSINEANTQPVISAFHADSTVVQVTRDPEGSVVVQNSTEAILDVLGTRGGGLAEVDRTAREGGMDPSQSACEVAAVFDEVLDAYGIKVDPGLGRMLSTGLADREEERILELNEAAARRSPAQYAASGNARGERAMLRFAEVVMGGEVLVTGMEERRHREAVRARVEEHALAHEVGVVAKPEAARETGMGWQVPGPDGRKPAWGIETGEALKDCLAEAEGTLFEADTGRGSGPRPVDRLLGYPDPQVQALAREAERKRSAERTQGEERQVTH